MPFSLAALLASTASVRPAGAYPLDNSACGGSTGLQQFKYSLSPDWSHADPDGGTYESASYAGIEEWNGVQNYDGSSLVNLVQNQSAPAGAAEILDWAPLSIGTYGQSCGSTPFTYFNDNYLNSDFANKPYLFRQVSRHEYGHVLALDHTGPYDTSPFNGTVHATMDAFSDGSEILSEDDAGQLMSLWSSTTQRRANPNFGFSNGSLYWAKSAGTSWKYIGTGGDPGEYVLVQATGTDYMYQDINIAQAAGHSFDAQPVGHFKLTSAGDTGTAIVDVLERQVTYGGPSSFYPITGVDQSTRTSVGSWTSCGGMKVTPTNSWATYSGTSCGVPSSWEGADIHLRVVPAGIHDSNGNSTYVSVDSLRVNLTLH